MIAVSCYQAHPQPRLLGTINRSYPRSALSRFSQLNLATGELELNPEGCR